MKLTQKQVDLFWEKVDVKGKDECWTWKAGRDPQGYGQVTINNKKFQAHRVAFLLRYGRLPIPNGLHSCDNPSCVNPNHIHAGTNQDNIKQKVERGRAHRLIGEKHPNHKLKLTQVIAIRKANGSQVTIAKRFGVSQVQVSRIKSGVSWKRGQNV
jgi:hypothetical protein